MDPITIAFFTLLGCLIIGAPTYRWWRENYSAKARRSKLTQRVLLFGTTEQRERLNQIQQREIDLELRLVESQQAAKILNNIGIRKKLEAADVDVDRLKSLLMTEEDVDRMLEE